MGWIHWPVCNSKTRNKVRKNTVLKNYPLYCQKCKQETLIETANMNLCFPAQLIMGRHKSAPPV